ncbi:MAG TPA: TIGR03435 family protein [Bryobacteraceae bacterium]|jgi:uncharacterized protein (TIGR03435 family)|nr:TIGR03435 family protein [Bryobacteraceae bacterium]
MKPAGTGRKSRVSASKWPLLLLIPLSNMLGQPTTERLPEFEVASIKPAEPGQPGGIDIAVLPGGRVVVTAASLLQLIAGAYGGLEEYQVSGPGWIDHTRYNIEATPPENDFGRTPQVRAVGRQVPSISMMRLRALLEVRFNLKTHFEMRERTAYDLEIAKGGPKLKQAGDSAGRCLGGVKPNGIQGSGCSMPWLASRLRELVFETDVRDNTGLTGIYDFDISYAPVDLAARPAGESPEGPSLFTAIGTLGLKLTAQKAPVKILIVDQVNKLTVN